MFVARIVFEVTFDSETYIGMLKFVPCINWSIPNLLNAWTFDERAWLSCSYHVNIHRHPAKGEAMKGKGRGRHKLSIRDSTPGGSVENERWDNVTLHGCKIVKTLISAASTLRGAARWRSGRRFLSCFSHNIPITPSTSVPGGAFYNPTPEFIQISTPAPKETHVIRGGTSVANSLYECLFFPMPCVYRYVLRCLRRTTYEHSNVAIFLHHS